MGFVSFLSDNRSGAMLALMVMLLGSMAYAWRFGLESGTGSGQMGASLTPSRLGLFDGLRLKFVGTADGDGELVASARNNPMARYKAAEGEPLPETGTMVLGYDEAADMRKEKKFSKIGDELAGFPVRSLRAGGVLEKTGSVLDMMHFVDSGTYDAMKGEEGRVFVRLADGKEPVLFYRLAPDELPSTRMKFLEGRPGEYAVHELGGEKYYPLVPGPKAARRMREEKMFLKTGDTVRGFFGRNAYIAGVLVETGGVQDWMVFSPLGENELR